MRFQTWETDRFIGHYLGNYIILMFIVQLSLMEHFEETGLVQHYRAKGRKDSTGFAKTRPAAQRPEDHRPRRPSGPAARSRFSTVFCPTVNAQVCNGFGRAKWTTASLNSFTIIILNNHFDPFIRCMLLREQCCHSLFIRPFTKPEREEVHSQRC